MVIIGLNLPWPAWLGACNWNGPVILQGGPLPWHGPAQIASGARDAYLPYLLASSLLLALAGRGVVAGLDRLGLLGGLRRRLVALSGLWVLALLPLLMMASLPLFGGSVRLGQPVGPHLLADPAFACPAG